MKKVAETAGPKKAFQRVVLAVKRSDSKYFLRTDWYCAEAKSRPRAVPARCRGTARRGLRNQWRPSRVGGVHGRRNFPFVVSGQVDGPKLRGPPAAVFRRPSLAVEDQHAPVRRPGRSFNLEVLGKQAFARPIGLHHANEEPPAGQLGEGDQVPARAPDPSPPFGSCGAASGCRRVSSRAPAICVYGTFQ